MCIRDSYDLAYDHISNDGSDHSFIDQSVTINSSPTFLSLDISDDVDVSNDINAVGTINAGEYMTIGENAHSTINVNGTEKIIQLGIHGDDIANKYVAYMDRASDTHSPTFVIARANGTHATPSQVSDDDILGQFGFMGWDGTDNDLNIGATIRAQVNGTPGNNDLPTEIIFALTQDGSADPIDRLSITDTAILPILDNDIDLGSESLNYKNFYASGYFIGDVSGDITGNAGTATALETARTISGVSFDGTANIIIDMDDMADGSTNAAITLVQEASYDAVVLSVENLDMDDLTDGSVNAAITLAQEASYDLAYAHISNDGSDHSFIDQSVTTTSSPTFTSIDISDDVDVSGDINMVGSVILSDASDSAPTENGAMKYDRNSETIKIGDGTNTRAIYTDGGIVFIIDGGGSAITTGAKAWLPLLKSGTLTGWDLTIDTSATITVDVWDDTYGNFPPTDADSMTNGHEPAISAATSATDADISDWADVAVTKGEYIRVNVDANDNATFAVLWLKVRWE